MTYGGVVVILLAGCRVGFDALPGTGDDQARACDIAPALGSYGTLDPTSVRIYDETILTGKITQLSGELEVDLSLRAQLWDGYGAFAGGAARIGTFDLAGSSATSCGVCIYLQRRIADRRYTTLLATSGVAEVTRLGPAGADDAITITDLELLEIDTATSLPIAGGCRVTLDSASLAGTASTSDEGVSGGGHGGDGASTGDND